MANKQVPFSQRGYLKAKGRNLTGQKFVQLNRSMQDSPAWRSLSPKSRAVWLEVVRRFNGHNNSDIPLSTREAAELCCIGNNTAAAAFHELIEKGFLKIGQYSDFRMKNRKARRWILTHHSLDGKPPSNEWRDWEKKIKQQS